MNRKKRILFVNEFSQLSTGFATYTHYLLPRLHATGKYEIAEHAIYINKLHPAIDHLPWKIYPNQPDPSNPKEEEIFRQNKLNEFGNWKFDEVCLDFQPDIVIDIRDPWMNDYLIKSPLRPYYKLIYQPTCDGEPQKIEWIEQYKQADVVTTYSYWAKYLLEHQSGGQLNITDACSPPVDINIFKPLNKKELRNEIGMRNDAFIIQTVMRNQPRKLFPDLFKAFVRFLEICKQNGNDELARKTYLYCHTSYPDVGWDIPLELRRHNLSHKVIFTYMCDKCGAVYPSFFQGDLNICKGCNNTSLKFPNTVTGVSKDVLAKIMACADLYIQYSICEGWGMPINDAKACGIPVMAVEYSAMTEQCYNGGAIPIKVQRMFQEPLQATNQLRALPDIQDTAQKIYDFFAKDQSYRDQLGKEARECVEKYYADNVIAKKWEDILDSIECPDHAKTWFSDMKVIQPNMNIPPNISNEQFVDWCYRHVLHEPIQLDNSMAQRFIMGLNLGYEIGMSPEGRPMQIPINRQIILNNMLEKVKMKNSVESYRYNLLVKKAKIEENTPKMYGVMI